MPLHIAAQNGHFKVVECLINKGAKVDLPSSEGFVPLHIAAQNGHFKVVELLINSGAKVDLPDADGWMPLHAAAQNGHFKVVELLINSGAKVDLPKSNGWMPLHIAAQNGHFKVVECLINKGAKVDLPDFQGLRPLHIAAGKGKLNCILVNEKLKKEGKPEFDIPSEQQYKNCAKAILLSHKVDISAKDENERNVYDIAHENGYDEIFQLIKLYESFYDLIKGKIQHDTLQKMTTSSELQEFFKDLSLTYFFANNIKLSNQIIDEYLNKLKLAEDAFNDNNQKSSFNKLLNQVKTKLAADEAEMVANIIAIETLIVETYDPVFFDIILQNTMERGNGLSNKWSIKKVATNYIGNVSNLGLIGRKYKADSEEFEGEAYGEGIILERLLSIISDVEPLSNNLLTSFSELFTKVKYNLSKELKAKGEEFIKLATDMEAISVIEEADEAYTGNIVKQSLDESEPLNQIGQVFVAQHELYIE
jgi:ankyrin repeat protein